MPEAIDQDRRRLLRRAAAMTIAAAHLGCLGKVEANDRVPREWSSLGRAVDWINSPPLTPENLSGKVVLVNFWTYTCINWLRTLPYVRAWAEKYRQGLVVIGVHTPEFPFEHDVDNVRRAVRQMRIDYPIAVDSDYAIWRAYDNHYWPALYVLDSRGRIRHHQFGEGEYEQCEKVIQRLLADAGVQIDRGFVSVDGVGLEKPADWGQLKSPENYLGFQRTANFAGGTPALNRRRTYSAPARLALNQWALGGEWTVGSEAIAASAPQARIVNQFHARDLHLVMGPSRRDAAVRFRVSIDGRPPGPAHGVDVDEDGNGTLIEQRLYQLIRQPKPIVDTRFEIEFLDAGAEAFSFTFG